ncbi:MAG TPA: SPFH domain-containing protein [Planctomycetota bacterium]|nr:SPFH domain-containing protein [Planctomycetota bacterium]
MTPRAASAEVPFPAWSGWPMVGLLVLWPVGLVTLGIQLGRDAGSPAFVLGCAASLLLLVALCCGFFVVQPNVARALVLFGHYRGTVRGDGFYWTNPFTSRRRVSVRAHNLASEKIKVNDLIGNPIEIAAVLVWRVRDTAQAIFDVEDYLHYVNVQSEAAIRQLASSHPYDEGHADGHLVSLRGHADEVAGELQGMLQGRLDRAGIEVLEARLSHLAYAQEIASAMLQRQQATAIVAARAKIVEGAVGMVEAALSELSKKHIIDLDPEKRAQLVGNLLVVLCGHTAPTPVLNTGTLYT